MSKGGRKGRISNELVAASCAAILTVYASGYLRTREEARRFGSEAQTRRPVRPPPTVATEPAIAPVAIPAAVSDEPQPAKQPLQASAAPSPVASPSLAVVEPANPAVAALTPAAAEQKSEPASEPDVVAAAPEPLPPPAWHDGYYTGWGQSAHGDIEASVTIRNGRIVNAGIVRCETRYPCSVIDSIINQPVLLQSPEVDRISRATESADAYYWGLVEALKRSEAGPDIPAAASP